MLVGISHSTTIAFVCVSVNVQIPIYNAHLPCQKDCDSPFDRRLMNACNVLSLCTSSMFCVANCYANICDTIVVFQPGIILIFSIEMQPIYLISRQEVSMNLDCSLQAIEVRHGRSAGLTETPLCVTLALCRLSSHDCVAVVCFALGPTSWHQSCFTLIYYVTGVWFPRRPSVC